MAGDVRLSPAGITGYMWLIIIGFVIWVGVPVINRTFGTSVMNFDVHLNVVILHGNVAIGGFLVLAGFLSYLSFRV